LKKAIFIILATAGLAVSLLLSVLSHRNGGQAGAKSAADPLWIKSEVMAKSLARTISEPLASGDDLLLSEVITQALADYPEAKLLMAANLKSQVVASSDEKLVGQAVSLPEGIKPLGSEDFLIQPQPAAPAGRSIIWTSVPVMLGRERIGILYLRTEGPKAAVIRQGLPLPYLAGQALASLLVLVFILLGGGAPRTMAAAPGSLAELEARRKDLERELEAKRKDLMRVESEAADHNRWLEMFRAEENDLAAQVKKLREERAHHEAEIEQGRKQLIEFEQLLREKQTKLEEVSQQLTARIQEGIELDRRLERVQRQEAELNQRMVELKKGEENLAQWLRNSKTEVQNLVQFIAEKRVEESEMEQTIEEKRREIEELNGQIAQQRAEIQELSEICEQWNQERERLSLEISEKQQSLTAVMQLLEGTKARLEKLQKQESSIK